MMFIIIVGAGNLGFYLAELLVDENHDVIVIEKDEKRCQRVTSEIDVVCIQGDATEQKVLEKAEIKDADALVALTGSDETNMVISLLAKELGAKKVATRISKVDYDERVLKKLGIDIVIHPEAAAAGYIAELITKPGVLDLAFISRGDAEILEIAVREDSRIIGKKVKEIEHPAGTSIIALYEGNKLVIPELETTVKQGDKLLILSKRDVSDKIRKMLA